VTFDWDPAKSDRNLVQRGFDFEFATQVFLGTYVEFDDTRQDYGERRVVALGLADEIPLTVVFTDRVAPDGSIVRRVISARLSHRKERRRYAQAIEAVSPPRDGEDSDEGPG
jgi:uncharacterized protein